MKVFIIIASLLISMSSHAGLIDLGQHRALDTDTHLMWLDLDQSLNVSWEEMDRLVQEHSSRFWNYRRATSEEVAVLFANAGLVRSYPDSDYFSELNVLGAETLLTALGSNYCVAKTAAGTTYLCDANNLPDGDSYRLRGAGLYLPAEGLPWNLATYGLDDRLTYPSAALLGYGDMLGSASYTHAWNHIGHFLVRGVPEPPTLAMLGLGLACLGFARRKTKA